MPGYHTFTSGETLTAANVNSFLMQQCVIQCLSTAKPSSPADGMTIYCTDTTTYMVYLSGTWENLATLGAFKSWTPTVTADTTNPTFSVKTGKYCKFGRMVFVEAAFTFATTGSGTYSCTLPFPTASGFRFFGNAMIEDVSASAAYVATAVGFASSNLVDRFRIPTATTAINWTNTSPFAVSTGDFFHFNMVYESQT